MAMFDTKYPNPSRQVTGTPQLYNDDVILNCKTLTGPITINLLEIPEGRWNTNWKLYIKDIEANASVNNITIVAGVGQLINGQASMVIDNNDGGVVVSIAGDTQFLGSSFFNTGGGPGGPDEKVKVNATDTTANFLQDKLTAGAGVTFTTLNVGANESLQIDVTGGAGITSITNANFLAEVAAKTLTPNSTYLITDAKYTQYGVYIKAFTNDSYATSGTGIFLNVDFQNVKGNFEGVWYPTLPAPTAGNSMVAWDGDLYRSITGVTGVTTPDLDAVNWLHLPRTTSAEFYILELDFVIYDAINNKVTLRQDKRNNKIELVEETKPPTFETLETDAFQWGNNFVFGNQATSKGVILNINWVNAEGETFFGNVVTGAGRITADNAKKEFSLNNVTTGGQIQGEQTATQVVGNVVSSSSIIDNTGGTGGSISSNSLSSNSSLSVGTLAAGNISWNNIDSSGNLLALLFNGLFIRGNDVTGGSLICSNGTGSVSNNYIGQDGILSAQDTISNASTVKQNHVEGGASMRFDGNDGLMQRNYAFGRDISGTNISEIDMQNCPIDVKVFANTVTGGGKIFGDTLIAETEVTQNIVRNEGLLTISAPDGFCTIHKNTILNGGRISVNNILSGQVHENLLDNGGSIFADNNDGQIINNVLKNESVLTATNNSGIFQFNVLDNQSTMNIPINTNTVGRYSDANIGNKLSNSSIQIDDNQGQVGGLDMTQFSSIVIAQNTGTLFNVSMTQIGRLVVNNLQADFGRNTISAGTLTYTDITTDITRKCKYINSCNFEKTLDLLDPTIYNAGLGTLTLDVDAREYGIFFLLNCTGNTITAITGVTEHHDITIVNNDLASTLRIDSTAVATALLNQLIQEGAPTSNNLIGRLGATANSDNLVVGKISSTGNPTIKSVQIFS